MTTDTKTTGLLPREVEVEFGKLTREQMMPVISQSLREASPVRHVRQDSFNAVYFGGSGTNCSHPCFCLHFGES